MFSRSAFPFSRNSANIGEIERRLRTLEKHLERIGGNTSKNASQAADRSAKPLTGSLKPSHRP